jgi:hypothetical protein
MQHRPFDPARDKAMNARMALRTNILTVMIMPPAAVWIASQPFDTMTGLALASCIFVFLVSACNLWRWKQGSDA